MSATLAGRPFSLDPEAVSWDFTVHTNDAPYVGGKVIQVFGATIGDITIEGHFKGSENFQGQLDFLKRMKAIGNAKVDNPKQAPLRFVWPEQRWDFQVYLKKFSTPDGARSVVHDPMVFAPRWRLTLFPVTGTNTLKKATVTTFIDRLSQGMGWKPSRYNGPLTFTELQAAMSEMGAADLTDFYSKAFGLGGTAQNPTTGTPTGPGTTGQTRGTISVDEALQVAKGVGLSGQDLRIMVAVAIGESGLDSSVVNDNPSTGDYSVGLWQINMLAHKTTFGTEAELKVPERNAAAMKSLLGSQGKNAWSVYRHGIYIQHMSTVNAAATRLGL